MREYVISSRREIVYLEEKKKNRKNQGKLILKEKGEKRKRRKIGKV